MIALLLAALACPGEERWAVKTLADFDAEYIDWQGVHPATVRELNLLPAKRVPNMAPRDWDETREEVTVYAVRACVVARTLQPDQDIHLVLRDRGAKARRGWTLIAESPDPECVAPSAYVPEIVSAREQFEDVQVGDCGVFLGVGLWDQRHGAAGAAVNGFELHPLLQYRRAR
jgi:hypothetical protein